MIYFLGAIFICSLILLRNTTLNVSNPLVIFWITWIMAILICLLNVFSSYPTLSISTYIFILVFLVSVSISFYIGKGKSSNNKVEFIYNQHRLIIAFNLLFMLVIVSYMLTIVRLGLPPLLTGNDRSTYYLSNGGELVYLLIYPCFLLGFYLVKYFSYSVKIAPQLVILFLITLTKGNKMTIFSILILACVFWGKKVKYPHLFLILGLILLVFWLSALIYQKNIINQDTLRSTRIALTGFRLPNKYYSLYDPLIYLSSNIYNLDGLIKYRVGGDGLGSESFKGIVQIIGALFPQISNYADLGLSSMQMTLTVPLFNTFSGLGLTYYDFGYMFSIIVWIIIGLISGILYRRSSTNRSLSSIFLYYVFFQTICLSFFSFYLGNLEVITNLVIIMFIDAFCREYIN